MKHARTSGQQQIDGWRAIWEVLQPVLRLEIGMWAGARPLLPRSRVRHHRKVHLAQRLLIRRNYRRVAHMLLLSFRLGIQG